jgi:hypothetical protein
MMFVLRVSWIWCGSLKPKASANKFALTDSVGAVLTATNRYSLFAHWAQLIAPFVL